MAVKIPEYITGKYAVGTETFSLTDSSRTDELGKNDGPRRIGVRMYYPADKQAVEGLERADVFTPVLMEKLAQAYHVKPDKMPPEMLKGNFYSNAPHAEDGRFPLILFSHGYNSYIEANNCLCCELASNGYIVASVGHAREAVAIVYDDGTCDIYDKENNKRMINNYPATLWEQSRLLRAKLTPEKALEDFERFRQKRGTFVSGRIRVWEKDMLCVLDELKSRYAQWIDFDRGVGVSGHSLGGATAYSMCLSCDEISCGVNIDGALFGEYGDKEMYKPFMHICCKENRNCGTRAIVKAKAPYRFEEFDNMKHAGFTDAKFFIPYDFVVGKLDGEKMYRRLADLHLDFFGEYLK